MKRLAIAIAIAVLGATQVLAASTVRVKVRREARADGVVYHYRVFNSSSRPIVALAVGRDYFHGVKELRTTPVGWTFEQGTPSASTTSASGWSPLLVTEEESEFHWFEWSVEDDHGAAIAPGQVRGGFSVRLPSADSQYQNGHWTVVFADSLVASGALEPDDNAPAPDTTAPVLRVELTPARVWPPNKKLVPIQATITVTDDNDPSPTVRLVSIGSNETIGTGDVAGAVFGSDDRQFSVRAWRTGGQKEGREYVVTYSARDAAGNTVNVSKVVRVPHDERH